MFDKLVTKVYNTDTSGFALKTDYNAKISETVNKIHSIRGLVITSALIAVKNKQTNVSNLVKKKDYDAKISEIETKVTDHDHDIYITTLRVNSRKFCCKTSTNNFSNKDRF